MTRTWDTVPKNEPAALKQRGHSRRICFDDPPHDRKTEDVEDRAQRPHKGHEGFDGPGFHFRGFCKYSGSTLSNGIPICEKITKQVLGQNLNWQHGKEGEEQGGGNHRYHISEIAGSRHFNVFDDIPKGPPAGHHAFLQYHQVFSSTG